jgi:hypothetical protein
MSADMCIQNGPSSPLARLPDHEPRSSLKGSLKPQELTPVTLERDSHDTDITQSKESVIITTLENKQTIRMLKDLARRPDTK